MTLSIGEAAFQNWLRKRTSHFPSNTVYGDPLAPRHEYDYYSAFLDDLQGFPVFDPESQHFTARYKTRRHPSAYTKYFGFLPLPERYED